MKDTLSFLVQSLLQKNKINIDNEELDFQIQSHPSYPSLHAITGVLSHFDVDNIAIRVPVDKGTLAQLPTSFIGQVKTDQDTNFALVIHKGENYKMVFSNKKSKTVSETTFLEKFTGILTAVEKGETKQTAPANTTNFQKPLFIIVVVLFMLLFFNASSNLVASIYFVLSLVGIAISLLIIQHDLGFSSKVLDSICSQESKTTNCNAVLNSKGATLYKSIKLSDVSLVYFVSISIAALFLSISNSSLSLLYLISSTALPVVAYSIYYQIRVSKNWCVLCLGIASVLLLQASVLLFIKFNFSALSRESILFIGFSFIAMTSLWSFVRSKLKQEQAFKKLKIASSKFKRNFDLFNTLLQESETVDTRLANTQEIVFGNPEAALNITVITNPFCGHCKSVHHLIESILKKHQNELSVTIRFNINTSNLESNGVLVSSRLLELYYTKGEQKCLEAMHAIYNNTDAEAWFAKWEKCDHVDVYATILETAYNWCLDNQINFTPEILINGKAYPKAYDRSDLIYFIEELKEACSVGEAMAKKSIKQQNP